VRTNLDPISSFKERLLDAGLVDKQEIKVHKYKLQNNNKLPRTLLLYSVIYRD